MATSLSHETQPVQPALVPPLQNGDRLTHDEFERRYRAMPHLKKAELVEGVVYIMPSPVSTEGHASPQADLATVLGLYRAYTPGVQMADNATVRLDSDNEPQPDLSLRIVDERVGQSRLEDGYIIGAPELVAEVAASSASYDLHDKMHAYRRNAVREYLVWRVLDSAIDWFVLRGGAYQRLPLVDGQYRSEGFPGLWLEPAALLAGDLPRVLEVLQAGLASDEHARFVAQFQATT